MIFSNNQAKTIDRFVPHTSTVPANEGQTVGLFLRERVNPATLEDRNKKVVLMIHGGFAPATVAYDLQYKDYSFMRQLALAGYDVFAMSHTGYALSPRPYMDDPANVDDSFQAELIPHILKEKTLPHYPFKLVSSQTEWDEIATIVDFICELRQVAQVSLVGWSTGTPRSGGYAVQNPTKVDKIVMFGIAPFFASEKPPIVIPEKGAPTLLQTKDFLLNNRWRDHVKTPDQLDDPQVCEAFWQEAMAIDPVGTQWEKNGQGIVRAPNRMNFGWKSNLAQIQAPTLMLLGEFDDYDKRIEAWYALSCPHKMFIKVAHSSHFMQFEKNRHLLYRATAQWLQNGSVDGHQSGEFFGDADGKLSIL